MKWLGSAGAAVAAWLALAAPWASAAPLSGYDGSPPFNCTIQDVGRGTDFPDPGADPFCVRFDKTTQNVDRLGIVDFLTKEPARVAAASGKCFYYQADHWTGSVVQSDGRTQVYNFEGRYWFDRARGAGGVAINDLRLAGSTFDATMLPGFPVEYRPFFGPGRGGLQYSGGGFAVEPRCVALARSKPVYRVRGTPTACRVAGGRIGRGLGGIVLGARRARVVSELGAPSSESLRAVRYCLEGGSVLAAAFTRAGSAGRTLLVKTDDPAFSTRGLGPGTTERKARRILRGERVWRRANGTKLILLRQRRRLLVAYVRRGSVRYVAVTAPRASMRTLGRLLLLVR